MLTWEDLRKRTGALDWLAEITVDVDKIRDEAERYYNQADASYSHAAKIESDARDACLAELGKAYRSLPDFRGDIPHPSKLLAGIPALRKEVAEAADDPNVALPGSGPKVDGITPIPDDERVSAKLRDIRSRLDGLPDAKDHNY
ncbi:hypothetical protein [Streptomyces armeniacus]|uniref:hypothetical protein n=1 Tax=Streptomyces armeniacus TaxID=83291 RepID=UPI001AD7F5CE|nr:hypothetical protein [Streptomyces armeniacus]